MMRLNMREGATNALIVGPWQTALVGPVLDDRGQAAVNALRSRCQRVITLRYQPSTLEIDCDSMIYPAELLANVLREAGGSFVIETTTLGFVEVLLACRAIRELGEASLDLLYVEPEDYRTPQRVRHHVVHRRDFELSDEVEDFSGIPGAAVMLGDGRPTTAVFLLGYEGARLDQALEQTGLKPSHCTVVFGVPAYNPGWEMHSFANNIRILQERQINSIRYAAAQSPAAAYSALSDVYESRGSTRMIIGPIGTKPHGIGCALFAADHPDVGIIYDHPTRSRQRSERVGQCHLFSVTYEAV